MLHLTHFKTRNTCNTLRISKGVIHITLYSFQKVWYTLHVMHFKKRNTCSTLRISRGVIHVTFYAFQEALYTSYFTMYYLGSRKIVGFFFILFCIFWGGEGPKSSIFFIIPFRSVLCVCHASNSPVIVTPFCYIRLHTSFFFYFRRICMLM